MHPVIYLTGAPASGKSSLTKELKSLVKNLEIFEYGARLTEYVRSEGSVQVQSDLRKLSSAVITPEHVAAVDLQLIDFVATYRRTNPIIIDSHAVTKESYGYRITPYKLTVFERLNPTKIWMLYTPPEVTVERIKSDPQGRPAITEEEARFHTTLQSSVATTYGMHLGIPVYLFDSSRDRTTLAEELSKRLV